jgi:hypothetical protein
MTKKKLNFAKFRACIRLRRHESMRVRNVDETKKRQIFFKLNVDFRGFIPYRHREIDTNLSRHGVPSDAPN